MAEVIEFLGTCNVFVARAIVGVPYYELEKAGCSVWEFDGEPLDFLNYIQEKEEEAKLEEVEPMVIPVPEELANGYYRISIKQIQEIESGITSKQVLLPFLRQGNYYQLEVICSHIPPWLETETLTGNLVCESEKIAPGEVRLVVRKKVCGE